MLAAPRGSAPHPTGNPESAPAMQYSVNNRRNYIHAKASITSEKAENKVVFTNQEDILLNTTLKKQHLV